MREMPTDSPRRFQLMDGLTVVAGLALGMGLWLLRARNAFGGRAPVDNTATLSDLLATLMLPMSWVVLVARLRSPRPGLPAVSSQPGFVAAFTIGVSSVVWWCSAILWRLRVDPGHLWEYLGEHALKDYANISPLPFAPPLAAAWGLLWLGRRWDAEASWIDRLGRALGVGYLGLALVHPFLAVNPYWW